MKISAINTNAYKKVQKPSEVIKNKVLVFPLEFCFW